MTTSRRWQYQMASMHIDVDRQIATTRVVGLTTEKTMAQLLTDNRQWVDAKQAHGQVVFYDMASLALNPQELLRSAAKADMTNGALVVPAALIVSPDQAELFETYAWLMAQKGVARAVFLSAEPAYRWASRWAICHEAVQRSAPKAAPEEPPPPPSAVHR